MPGTTRVRPVEMRDAQQWLRLRTEFWPDATNEVDVERFFKGAWPRTGQVLVAVDGDTLLGYVELAIRPFAEGCRTDHVGYLEGWYVASGVRGQGIGRALLNAGEQWARDQGCTEFASDTQMENTASDRAHLACGFAEDAQIRCYAKAL